MSALIFPCSVADPFSRLVAKFSHYKYLTRKDCQTYLTLFKIGLFGVTHGREAREGGGVQEASPPLSLGDISIFSPEISRLLLYHEIQKKD